MMYDGGVLPNDWTAYIAVMAAGRHHCGYFIDTQEQEFLDADGDETWLIGLRAAPKKLQVLEKVNAILAHQPWRLEAKHIAVSRMILASFVADSTYRKFVDLGRMNGL